MNWQPLPGGLKGIEDRRHENPNVAPSDPDALLRGMPQTPHEFELYKQKLARDAAYRAGIMPEPQPESLLPGLGGPAPTPGPGDPAGLEARRAAIQAQIAQLQATAAEIDLRLSATKKAPKR